MDATLDDVIRQALTASGQASKLFGPDVSSGAGGSQQQAANMAEKQFTYRSARSGSLLAGIGIAILAETFVLHLWIVGRHPLIAWSMTAIRG